MPTNGRGTWWVKAMPSWQRVRVGRSVTSRPSRRTRPASGAELPRRKLQHGRLAGPVGADHAERLAGVEPHAQVVDDPERPIRLGDTLQLQERRHVSSSLPADHGTGALGGPPEGSGEPQGGAPVDRGELAPPTWNGDRLWSRCQPRPTVLRVGDRL